MTGLWPHESADTRSWVRFRRRLHDSPRSVRCRVTWTCDLDRAADLTSMGSRRSALITGDRLFGSGGNRPMRQSRQGPRAASPPVRLTAQPDRVDAADQLAAGRHRGPTSVGAHLHRVMSGAGGAVAQLANIVVAPRRHSEGGKTKSSSRRGSAVASPLRVTAPVATA